MLECDNVIVWSWDDLKGAVCMSLLPPQWAPLFVFDIVFSARELEAEV